MAHHRSAKKRIRQTEKRTIVNRSRMSRIKTFVRKVEDALAQGDYDTARSAFVAAGAGFVGASFGINYQFANRSFLMWAIDAGYHTAQFVLFALVLAPLERDRARSRNSSTIRRLRSDRDQCNELGVMGHVS